MRLMLLTFRKDVRRLWPAAAISWVLLFYLARADRWRNDWMPSAMEGWMTLIVAMSWACLAALVVLEEPLAGERNFWTTRPHRWLPLLAAKLLFVVLAIHVPSLISDFYILGAHGFSPLPLLGGLLGRQALYFGAITLPAIALASLVRSFTHFVVAGFVVAAAILVINGGMQPSFEPTSHEFQHMLVRVLVALAAVLVIAIQYATRRAIPARALAVFAALGAASIAAWLPARAEYARMPQGPRITLRTDLADRPIPQRSQAAWDMIFLPIEIQANAQYHLRVLELDLTTADGHHLRWSPASPSSPQTSGISISYLGPGFRLPDGSLPGGPQWIGLRFDRGVWERIRNSRVRIAGSVALHYYRTSPTVSISPGGTRDIPEVGRCSALVVGDTFNEAVKVICESPNAPPAGMVALNVTLSAHPWHSLLSTFGSTSFAGYGPPRDTWMSPLYRSQSWFRLGDLAVREPGSEWVIPRLTKVEITPEIATGKAVATFDFADVPFGSYLATPWIRQVTQ